MHMGLLQSDEPVFIEDFLVSGAMMTALHAALCNGSYGCYFSIHFADGAQRRSVPCLRSHSHDALAPGPNARCLNGVPSGSAVLFSEYVYI